MHKRRIADSDEESLTTIKSSDIDMLGVSSYGVERDDGSEDVGSLKDMVEDDSMDYILEDEENADAKPASEKVSNLNSVQFREELIDQLVKYFTGSEEYATKIRRMCSENGESIDVNYMDLAAHFTGIEEEPLLFLDTLGDALTRATQKYFPSYQRIRQRIEGRVVGLPVIEALRDLRNSHLNKLVRVRGIVTRRTGVFSEFKLVCYTCLKCKSTFGPLTVQKPSVCFECQGNGPFIVNASETVYKDFQQITLQENPSEVPAGSLPRSRDVILRHSLIDTCRPGDEVDVVGVYKNSYSVGLNSKQGFPVFNTLIEASSINVSNAVDSALTAEDIKEIKMLAKHPQLLDVLLDAMAPSISGNRNVKLVILLALVGGVSKNREGVRIRGDINVLLLGDPGTAKSQLLRFAASTSGRALIATGQGSSGVGLTASLRRDPALGEWVLEGGALVLADSGLCCIDEFDKMSDVDRVAIHEAMEQQSISISKAGIVASLHARCAVVAAANPIRGRYNPALSFSQNVNLSDPIVSRFDILCVMKDTVDAAEDSSMASFIIDSHMGSTAPSTRSTSITHDMLKKYIAYAKNTINPVIPNVDSQKIANLYSELRKESISSGIPITVRHVESIIRVSEAFAKLRLSFAVSVADIDAAIAITLNSFLSAQKYAVSKQLRRKFSRYFEENSDELALFILKEMATETLSAIAASHFPLRDFVSRCKSSGLNVSDKFFSTEGFKASGFVLQDGIIKRTA